VYLTTKLKQTAR